MIDNSYDRYGKFRQNNRIRIVPFVEIPKKDTDMYYEYRKGQTRLDLLSYDYYQNPNYGWLILQANPEYGSMEFDIPDGAVLRIPYPLDSTISEYNNGIDNYNSKYIKQS